MPNNEVIYLRPMFWLGDRNFSTKRKKIKFWVFIFSIVKCAIVSIMGCHCCLKPYKQSWANMTFSSAPTPSALVWILWTYVHFSFSFLSDLRSPASGWFGLAAPCDLKVVSSVYV